MMTHAYSQLYLNKASRAVGAMLHDAVTECGLDGDNFLDRFIQSGVAEQLEAGNPKYIAGKSGLELFLEVMERTSDETYQIEFVKSYDRSPEYWVGWMLAHYQWYSGHSFRNILDTISYNELIGLYGTLHEADVRKSYDVLSAHFAKAESKLKMARKRCGLTQTELAEESGISPNTIRAYEQKSKDINKAGIDIVMKLANTLRCNVSELLD